MSIGFVKKTPTLLNHLEVYKVFYNKCYFLYPHNPFYIVLVCNFASFYAKLYFLTFPAHLFTLNCEGMN